MVVTVYFVAGIFRFFRRLSIASTPGRTLFPYTTLFRSNTFPVGCTSMISLPAPTLACKAPACGSSLAGSFHREVSASVFITFQRELLWGGKGIARTSHRFGIGRGDVYKRQRVGWHVTNAWAVRLVMLQVEDCISYKWWAPPLLRKDKILSFLAVCNILVAEF